MANQGINILHHGGEVGVRDVLLFAELLDNRGNLVVVGVVDAREEVMLNLVVKASV